MLQLQRRCGWESLGIFAICILDMLSTLYWVHIHKATEANPWLALWLKHGDWPFCIAKLMSFMPLLVVAAYYRPRRPRMISVSLRTVLALYLIIYAVCVGRQFVPAI